MTVNHDVGGSSPSVPVLVLTQQIQYRFKVVVAGSSPALSEMTISSVGRARKMRTVKETKNLCNAETAISQAVLLVQLQIRRNERRNYEFFRCNERRK